jgi:hypothetical protein
VVDGLLRHPHSVLSLHDAPSAGTAVAPFAQTALCYARRACLLCVLKFVSVTLPDS